MVSASTCDVMAGIDFPFNLFAFQQHPPSNRRRQSDRASEMRARATSERERSTRFEIAVRAVKSGSRIRSAAEPTPPPPPPPPPLPSAGPSVGSRRGTRASVRPLRRWARRGKWTMRTNEMRPFNPELNYPIRRSRDFVRPFKTSLGSSDLERGPRLHVARRWPETVCVAK